MNRFRQAFIAGVAAVLCGALTGTNALAQSYQIREVSGRTAKKVPVTISFLAAKGEYVGKKIQPIVNGIPHKAQVDVLSTWPDGSVCHALVTYFMDVAAYSQYTVTFKKAYDPPTDDFIPAKNLLAPLHSTFEFKQKNGGKSWKVEFTPEHAYYLLREAWLGDGSFAENVFGPARRDYEWKLRPVNVSKSAEEHPQVETLMRWQVFHKSWPGVLVEVMVENNRTDAATKDDIEIESAAFKVGREQKVLRSMTGKNLLCQQRFAVQFWIGKEPPELIIRPDLSYLAMTGLMPPLDWTHPISDKETEGTVHDLMDGNGRGEFDPEEMYGIPLDVGPVYRYQPGTGDRADIGWLPRWTMTAVNGKSALGARVSAAGDMNGSGVFPIHNRDAKTGELGLKHDHPFWRDKIKFEPRLDNGNIPNIAHMPLLGYVSYALTGRKVFLEEFVCWTAFAHRDWYPNDGMIKHMGSRDGAWALRNSALAIAIMPDKHPLKAYFKDRFDATAARFVDECDFTLPLGTFGSGGWRTSGRSNWPCGNRDSPWCNSWFTAMCELGNRVHGNKDLYKLFAHNWKYFQEGYGGHDSWKAPNGETIYQDPDQLMQYSKCISVYTPCYNSKGEWDTKEGSVIALDNFAATQWYERIQCDYGWSGSEEEPTWPKDGPEPWKWRPIGGKYSPPEKHQYHEYGGGRVGLFWAGELRGMTQAQDVIDVVEPWIQSQLDHNDRPLGMRLVSYYTGKH